MTYLWHSNFLVAVYLYHHSNYSHPSLVVVYLFLSQKEWQSSILWRVLYLFWLENLQSSIAWVFLSAVVYLFPKKVGSSHVFFRRYFNYFYRILAAIHSFNGTVYFFDVKICSHAILPTHFLSAYFRTLVAPAGIYLFKVDNRNTRTRCEVCSKLTIKTPERPHWRPSGVFIVNFEHIYTSCSSVSVVNFEKVNADWDR